MASDRIFVREATMADADVLLRWRNDPGTRRNAHVPGEVPREAHLKWLDSSLRLETRVILIASDPRGDVGTVRWDHACGRVWQASITVAPECRGQGVARRLLSAGESELVARRGDVEALIATIHCTNTASQRLFVGSGYQTDGVQDADGFMNYEKRFGFPTSPATTSTESAGN